MNQREAKREACFMVSILLDREIENGMFFPSDGDMLGRYFSDADLTRLEKSLGEIHDELFERSRGCLTLIAADDR